MAIIAKIESTASEKDRLDKINEIIEVLNNQTLKKVTVDSTSPQNSGCLPTTGGTVNGTVTINGILNLQ